MNSRRLTVVSEPSPPFLDRGSAADCSDQTDFFAFTIIISDLVLALFVLFPSNSPSFTSAEL